MDMKYRSDCPISSALDILGDKWSLLIIRDIMFGKKSTFKDFSGSSEKIASGILANRLAKLEAIGILHKGKLPDNKKTVIYSITEKGIELLPVIVDLILWSDKNLNDHINEGMKELAKKIRVDREGFIKRYSDVLRENSKS